MTDKSVDFSIEDALGIITLSRHHHNNACDPVMIQDLLDAAKAAETASPDAILVRAEGENFCVGADLKHLGSGEGSLAENLRPMADTFHEAVERLAALPVPIIGAVQGNAVGAGFGLALLCDHLLVAENARFSTGYIRLGLSADAGVSFFLTRALGERLARSLLLVPRTINADEALRLGLVDRIVSADKLQQEARLLATQLSLGSRAAYAAIKLLTSFAPQHTLRQHLDMERDKIIRLARDPSVQQSMRRMLR